MTVEMYRKICMKYFNLKENIFSLSFLHRTTEKKERDIHFQQELKVVIHNQKQEVLLMYMFLT